MMEYFEEVYEGRVKLVDASSPTVLALECMAASASNSIDNGNSNMARRYASLATELVDLYPHMQGNDYDDIFALPSSLKFSVTMQVKELREKAVNIPGDVYKYVSIPKDTEVQVEGAVYTFSRKVEVRLFTSGAIKVIQLKGDHENLLTSYSISSYTYRDDKGVEWVMFELDLEQLSKFKVILPISQSVSFNHDIRFTNQFKDITLYMKSDTGWDKITTTYKEDVYDPFVTTSLITVKESEVNIFLPQDYTRGRKLLVILETTQGELDIDYYRHNSTNFGYSLKDLNAELTEGDRAFNRIACSIASAGRTYGGRDGLTFVELRERIMGNTVGLNIIPITQRQVLTTLETDDFDSYRNIDSLTQRLYVLTSDIPLVDNDSFNTELDGSFIHMRSTIDTIRDLTTVVDNGDQVTILPSTTYKITGEEVSIMDPSYMNALKESSDDDIVHMEQRNLRSSPYFYVIHYRGGILETKVYQLDKPEYKVIDYTANNYSSSVFMTTDKTDIEYDKDIGGYVLRFQLKTDSNLNKLEVDSLFAQLFITYLGKRYHIEMSKVERDSYQLVFFEFIITTNHRITGEGLHLTDFMGSNGSVGIDIPIELLSSINIVYGVTGGVPDGYIASKIDKVTYQSTDLAIKYPVSHETMLVQFGLELKHLWKDCRLIPSQEYKKWEEDVPALYERTVVPYDPEAGDDIIPFTLNANCVVEYTPSRVAGDIMVNEYDDVIYLHKRGDLKIENGLLVPLNTSARKFTLDIFTFNAITEFIVNPSVVSLMDRVEKHIAKRSTEDIYPLVDIVLEHTQLLYKPKDSLGLCKVTTGDEEVRWISKEQRLKVAVLVGANVYTNDKIRDRIEVGIIETLNTVFKRLTLSYSDITVALMDDHKDLIISVSLTGFGGVDDKDLTLTLSDAGDRLSIAKKLALDEVLNVTQVEDIDFVFRRHVIVDEHQALR